ncbi:CoA transferase [Pseudooceanicola aestuarii]|uniref:CoA transferase n=1 Tax=Pseudooceanicola aestuarii TaxID=2697319 RepID=UPI0013D7F9EB|nr:CoA transferase [Pseudooceanicola aestuarii]
MTDLQGAFSGMRVLDFTAGVAGPHATQLMAMHGAEVIKVEPLAGEWGRTLGRDDLPRQPRFRSSLDRLEHENELNALLIAAFATRDSRDWAARLTEADVMNSVVNSYADYFADPHVAEIGACDWVDHPVVGQVPLPLVPGAPRLSEASPEVGQHSAEILGKAGLSDAEVSGLVADGGAVI